MSAAVGFVGVLRHAGPRRSKRVRVDACVGRLVLRERGSILGSRTSGDIVHTKHCGRMFDRKAMMHGPCILIYLGPHEIFYSGAAWNVLVRYTYIERMRFWNQIMNKYTLYHVKLWVIYAWCRCSFSSYSSSHSKSISFIKMLSMGLCIVKHKVKNK